MKYFFLGSLFFVIGFFGVVGFRFWQAEQTAMPQKTTHSAVTTTQPSSSGDEVNQGGPFVLKPPSTALSGILMFPRGTVEIKSRDTGEYLATESGTPILTGESVVTKEMTNATVTIDNFLTTYMGENAEVVFANLYPTNMVIQQKAGKVEYAVEEQLYPISIRALHALVALSTGSATINIIDTDVSMTVASGSATIALVDLDNNTNVWKLTDGQRANIDDAARDVTIIDSPKIIPREE